MPAAGKVVIQITPAEAKNVAEWLRTRPAPLIGLPKSNLPLLPNGIRVEIVRRLERIASRRRTGAERDPVSIEIDRDDLVKIEASFYTGMFARRMSSFVPDAIRQFAHLCTQTLRQRRGRKRLHGVSLKEALDRQRSNVGNGTNPRQMKRLRKRVRADDQWAEEYRQKRAQEQQTKIERLEALGLSGAFLDLLARPKLP